MRTNRQNVDFTRAMALHYGMSEALGNVAYDRERSAFLQSSVPMPQSREYSEETENKVDTAVQAIIVRHLLARWRFCRITAHC